MSAHGRRKPGKRKMEFVFIAATVVFIAIAGYMHPKLQSLSLHDDHVVSASLNRFLTPKAIEDPTPASGRDAFSACLLVMDDNHRLVEWLAYHYHVLPLRHLIVAVDPRSKTSPTEILNRWRRMGMVIEEWDDFKFMRRDIASHAVSDEDELQVKRDRHRVRQKVFYRQCLISLKEAGRSYTMLIDTDEFLMYNHAGGEDFEAWETEQTKFHAASKFADRTRIRPKTTPPSPKDPGAMMDYIRREKEAGHPFYETPCLACPRLQFGAVESTAEERERGVPAGFDAERFDTMRFRKHAHRNDFVKNGLAKVIVDVSRVDMTNTPRFKTLHRPIKSICSAPWKDEWDSGLRIYHYLGSWESYSFRDDSRRGGERSREGWAFKARNADFTDDNIRPWLQSFVDVHGAKKATMLLEGAGLPKSYRNDNEKEWTIMFLDEIMGVNETKGNAVRVEFDNFVREMHGKKPSN